MLMLVVLVDQEDKLGGNVDHCDNEEEELVPVGLQLIDDGETQPSLPRESYLKGKTISIEVDK